MLWYCEKYLKVDLIYEYDDVKWAALYYSPEMRDCGRSDCLCLLCDDVWENDNYSDAVMKGA